MAILKFKPIQPGVVQADKRKSFVEAHGIGVKYLIGSKREDLQSRAFNKLLRRPKKKEFWALKDVNFTGYSGDIFGIIGERNGGRW